MRARFASTMTVLWDVPESRSAGSIPARTSCPRHGVGATMVQEQALTDAEAVRAVLGDQRDAFAVLVYRHLPTIRALALSRTSNHADAEDVTQETLLRAFKYLDTLRDASRFGSWVAMIAQNVARKVLAQRLKRARMAEELYVVERPPPRDAPSWVPIRSHRTAPSSRIGRESQLQARLFPRSHQKGTAFRPPDRSSLCPRPCRTTFGVPFSVPNRPSRCHGFRRCSRR